MKKTNLYFMATAMAAVLALGACDNDENEPNLTEPVALQVEADINGMNAATRISGSAFEEGDVINVVAAGSSTYQYQCNASGSWNSVSPYYFENTDNVDFRAWYSSVAPVDNVISIATADATTAWPASNYLLVTPTVSANAISNMVSFRGGNAFGHVLTLFTLVFTPGEGVSSLNGLTDYTLSGLTTAATFNTLTCTLAPGSESDDITRSLTGSSTGNVTAAPIILIPQPTASGIGLEVTFNGVTYSTTLMAGGTLAAGTHYTYTISVDNTELSVSNVSITPWDPQSGTGSVTI